MWREAAADARQAIRADPCFVKAHLHLGKVLLQQRQLGEAREAVQRGMATLQEAGQNMDTSKDREENVVRRDGLGPCA